MPKKKISPTGTCKTRAFTLVELLVVIAIIALLLSILYPSLNSLIALSHEKRCLSNTRQIGNGMRGYMGDNGYHIPPLKYAKKMFWADYLLPYLGGGEVYICPASTGRNRRGKRQTPFTGSDGQNGAGVSHSGDPRDDGPPFGVFDYAYNQASFGYHLVDDNDGGTSIKFGKPRPIFGQWTSNRGEHFTAAETMFIGEGCDTPDRDYYWERTDKRNPGQANMNWRNRRDEGTSRRHRDGMNVTWADGHASYVALEDMLEHGQWWGPGLTEYMGEKNPTPGYGPYTPLYPYPDD